MGNTGVTLLILAAGMGSRYGGLKQLDPVGPNGELIVDYSVFDAWRAGFSDVVFVIRPELEAEFKGTIGDKYGGWLPVSYVHQTINAETGGMRVPGTRQKPWGTGQAILVAKNAISNPFAAINADDFYGAGAFMAIKDHFTAGGKGAGYAMVGYELQRTLSPHGEVSRGVCNVDGSNSLISITERRKICREPGGRIRCMEGGIEITFDGTERVSMNFWGFTPDIFDALQDQFCEFLSDHRDSPVAEFLIVDAVARLIREHKARVTVLPARDDWFGVTYQEDKPQAMAAIQGLIEQGAYPEKLLS